MNFIRLKNMSPVYALKREEILMHKRNTSNTTEIYTENTKSNINNFNASSSSPFMEQNNSSSESNIMNDSLERIGTSLQLLIEEAQASLLTNSSAQQHQQSEAENISTQHQSNSKPYKNIIPLIIIITMQQNYHHQPPRHHHLSHHHHRHLVEINYGLWIGLSFI
ncbi:hypothetical protein INT46_008324 [Mucor plumbeus]|uniref:Uncharacterized protein n=1 Tax=Mucor plumbeus TaxID=97098 RepID=A0A8H7UZR3_9FUNG|nr:hypothetical protein INT46_008324 [Mucor plumbeus]